MLTPLNQQLRFADGGPLPDMSAMMSDAQQNIQPMQPLAPGSGPSLGGGLQSGPTSQTGSQSALGGGLGVLVPPTQQSASPDMSAMMSDAQQNIQPMQPLAPGSGPSLGGGLQSGPTSQTGSQSALGGGSGVLVPPTSSPSNMPSLLGGGSQQPTDQTQMGNAMGGGGGALIAPTPGYQPPPGFTPAPAASPQSPEAMQAAAFTQMQPPPSSMPPPSLLGGTPSGPMSQTQLGGALGGGGLGALMSPMARRGFSPMHARGGMRSRYMRNRYADGGTVGAGQELAAQGRGPDSTLVHMAPSELHGLQALAQSQGQSLSINPKTGLPEAGILSSLLPMLIGAVLTPLTGGIINPMTAGLLVGAGTGLATHSLSKGLMAGLSAFGGAGLGSALSGAISGASAATPLALQSAGSQLATTAAPSMAGLSGMPASMANIMSGTAANLAPDAASVIAQFSPEALSGVASAAGALPGAAAGALPGAVAAAAPEAAASQGLMGIAKGTMGRFGDALRAPGMGAIPGTGMTAPGVPSMVPRMLTTGAGTMGIMNAISGAMTPSGGTSGGPTSKYNPASYAGPYKSIPRKYTPPPADRDPNDSSEWDWYAPGNPDVPYTYTTQAGGPPPGYPGYTPPSKAELDQRMATLGYAEGGTTDAAPAAPAKKKKNFFENSLPFGLLGSLMSSGDGADAGPLGLAGLLGGGGKGALAALGGMGGMGLMQALGYGGNPLAPFAARSPQVPIDPETGLPMRPQVQAPGVQAPAVVPPAIAGLAKGGVVALKPGGFVMDARTVSELGNGSSSAGKEILKKHGGQPIDGGKGDGVSDGIRAQIKGGPRARVARDEVKFSPQAVARIGRGDKRRGAQKLYGLMAQAKMARAHAGRGQDTGLRRSLA